MKYIIPAAIAIGVGLIVLISYLLPAPGLLSIRQVLTDWAVVLGGLAVLVAILNYMLIQTRRIDKGEPGWIYGFLTFLMLLLTLFVGVFEQFQTGQPVIYMPGSIIHSLFNGIIVASLAALSSLAMIFLIVSAVRMLRDKPGGWSIFFLIIVVIVLVGWLPFTQLALVGQLRTWLLTVPAAAGARGIVLGVALGTIVIGLRVLTGAERPYKD